MIKTKLSGEALRVKKFWSSNSPTFLKRKGKALALEKVEELDENTILFLNKAKSLRIEIPLTKRLVTRKNHPLQDLVDAKEIKIDVLVDEAEYPDTKRYWLWKWIIGGKEKPLEAKEIQEAVSDLPENGPESARRSWL